MSTLSGGPNIVTDSLIFNVDAANVKSYVSGSTTWRDLSRGGNNSTLTNGPTFNSENGGSIVFDGVNDYVTGSFFINAGSNFSVFAWVRPGAINIRNGIVGNSYPYSSRQGFFLSTATNYSGTLNTFFISIGSDAAFRTAANNSLILNVWNYIGGTVTNGGQDIKLYVNGIETSYHDGILSAGTITYSTNQFLIGGRHSASLEIFRGNIAGVQIYNKILTSTEILQNYNATKTRFGL
jgi:hypothetical protein